MSNPLFIVGTGRSGTTLLRAMLNAHPELHLSKESSFFLETNSRHFQRHPEVELERYFRSAPFLWLKLSPSSVRALLPANPVRSDVFRAVLPKEKSRKPLNLFMGMKATKKCKKSEKKA